MIDSQPLPLAVAGSANVLDPLPTAVGPQALYTKPLTRGSAAARIDVVRAVAGLRHIDPSAEPAMVFSNLAAVCVPAVCDEVVIDLVENGHGYRIRRPGSEWTAVRPAPESVPPGHQSVVLSRDAVTLRIAAAAASPEESEFSGSVVCIWTSGYVPTAADAALVQLMVDHAVALVPREQSSRVVDRRNGGAPRLQGALARSRRIASAVGVVMALHHVDQTQAMNLLIRISDRSHVDLHALADTVVTMGSLPMSRKVTAP